ncbi:hypothetical protein HHI36_000232 [Cryptolaemus montrouzieri]|uniref:non-specific serine/threonine protein kinase n=1 Tax=Cryptolaemus montrouzieri TaxID=559131 RepID=A0ABD2P4S3_9CUCU
MEESPEIRQENELSSLNSIYSGDIKDLRTGQNKWKPLDLVISLKPQQGSSSTRDIYVQVDLRVTCSKQYPNQIPKISFERAKGISQVILNKLRSELLEEAKKYVGRELIFELCQYTQEFLHKHNKPMPKSFHEEMIQRQEKEKMQDEQAKLMEENRKIKECNEEISKIYEQRLESSKSRKKSPSENTLIEDEETGRRDSIVSERRKNSYNESSDDSQCSHQPTDNIFFENNGSKQILRGKCLKHTDRSYSVFSGIDTETGQSIIINEWKVAIPKPEVLSMNKQVSLIEQEFSYVKKLKHRNLSSYHIFSCSSDGEYFTIHVLKEFINGSNCQSLFLVPNVKADIQYIKFIANGVLQALDHLHKKSVIHRGIKDTCVYVNNKGIVKVSNYCIHQRLTDLANNIHSTIYNKKMDIYKFGLLLLGLMQGSAITEEDDISVPDTLPSDLYDFLNKCLSKDERDRPSASQLLSHQFFNEKPIVDFKLDDRPEDPEQEADIPNNEIEKEYYHSSTNRSRIHGEFEFIENIGEGAFGNVKKYKNKLDGRFYAIKRIKLNPSKKQIKNKILREVQLLSRLCHENVVRYYNSWIETSEETNGTTVSSESSSYEHEKVPMIQKPTELTINDNIELLAPPLKNQKVSVTYDSKSQAPYQEDSSSDSESSDEDEDNNETVSSYSEKSQSIIFEDSENKCEEVSGEKSKSVVETPNNITKIDHMYIQMEFCEKSTLRSAIDDDLYKDKVRVLRLFREILEGLAHIHQQGMIHRDLKPANIFLDSKDHVKIGDFGLATTILKDISNEFTITKSAMESIREEAVDESKTGHIGTLMYVAPEVIKAKNSSKAIYNEKVDIYSLGIILFEMCYRAPTTLMERSEILEKIRQKEIIFPNDYEKFPVGKHADLIRLLLDHDVSKRPTSSELLESKYVPPPILEDKGLMDLLRHTLHNPQLKGYKHLVASCFSQTFSTAQDITYDRDSPNTSLSKPLEVYYEFVKEITVEIFRKHGGQNLVTPLLMPNNKSYSFYSKEDKCVRLMTHDGSIVSLPYDLRVPFARYVAWNNISLFRRYSIERVYREKKIFGFIPRELYECAFDIITPHSGNLISDAEILYIVFEILTQLPVFRDKNVIIHLNHDLLLEAILVHYGLKIKDHPKFISVYSDVKEEKLNKNDLITYLLGVGLSDTQAGHLCSTLSSVYELSKMMNNLSGIIKRSKTEYSHVAKQALEELKTIIDTAVAMGVTFDILIAPGLICNVQQFSGMICQFVCEFKKRKHNKMEVLAAGGRYDRMIAHYRDMQKGNITSKELSQSGVGISISLDKIVQAIQKEELLNGNAVGRFDLIVCSLGNKHCSSEIVKVLSSSTTNIRWTILEAANMKEVDEYREELRVPHVIILKDTDQYALLNWEKERFQDKTYSLQDLIDELPRWIKPFSSNSIQDNSFTRSDSKSSVEKQQTTNSVTTVFHEKTQPFMKKRYENQISAQLSDVFKRLVGPVIVLALNVDSSIIKTLAATLEFQTEELFQKSVSAVIDKHPKSKKYWTKYVTKFMSTSILPISHF